MASSSQPEEGYAVLQRLSTSFQDRPQSSQVSIGESQTSVPADSRTTLPKTEIDEYTRQYLASPTKRKRGPVFWLSFLVAFVVVVLAIILPVYFLVIKKDDSSSQASSGGSGNNGTDSGNDGHGSGPSTSGAITGGDGSEVTLEDGSKFKYSNQFGGFWVADPSDPFGAGGKPNSWTPALNESWTYGKDRINGVGLGGWFVLEPFISPALFQKYPDATDEWTLSEAMAADTAGGGLNQLEEHYKTFIIEKDFAEIAGAGLNWVRLPIPFWAIDKWDGEPFLEKVCWKYILKALSWARKYGLRVNLDLHTIPGSQSGYNHSGKGSGQVNFMYGPMGVANAQRALNYIRIITEFISQPEYQDVVQMFGIMNEAVIGVIGRDALTSFYREVHDMIRGITGVGEGKGFYISIHDGFEEDMTQWDAFLAGSDRVVLDRHPYTSFSRSTFDDPIATGTGADAGGVWVDTACAWADESVRLSGTFGFNYAGEWSNGYNDCGLFLTGVGGTQTYGGDCSAWEDATTWDDSTKAGVAAFNAAQMDALKDYFFWTWKIGKSAAGTVQAPLWSYQLGLEDGWILKDPRKAKGKCGDLPEFDGDYQPYMTGGAGAGTITAAAAGTPFPPAQINGVDVPVTELPQYTSTGSVHTLPGPSATVNGWFDAQDTGLAPTPIPGCAYPDPWNAVDAAIPTGCGADAADPDPPTTSRTTTSVPIETPTDEDE
ncbi:putative ectomycorrhiza-upregulated exo-beta-1,3-glucanase GH5 [Mucidula mucida]|nr:putative ectomycorrhiza-upregulated exo-beta-1,3-glucanase GH5 [Mucidula mucida]